MHDEIAERSCTVHEIAPVVDPHECHTRWVVALTTGMMVAELAVGSLTRSLALTADGWHMATRAGALGLSALAYWFARTRAKAKDFTFGTGKVNALLLRSNVALTTRRPESVHVCLQYLCGTAVATALELNFDPFGADRAWDTWCRRNPHTQAGQTGDLATISAHKVRMLDLVALLSFPA